MARRSRKTRKKSERQIPLLVKKLGWTNIVLALVIIFLLAQLFYFYDRNKKLESEISDVRGNLNSLSERFSVSSKAITEFYNEAKETDANVITSLAGTVDWLEDTVKVINENVNVYNGEMEQIYSNFQNLDQRVKYLEYGGSY